MEVPTINTLMVEGSFDDQILEMAQYIDTRKGSQALAPELEALIEAGDKETALKKIVDASSVLSSAPEKEYIPAYNLLIHLIRSSTELPNLLPTVLQNLATPPPTSPHNGPALSIHALSTIFNVLPADSKLRYPVLKTTLKLTSDCGMYETLQPQLKNVEKWVGEWGSSPEEIRELYLSIADTAEKFGDNDEFYTFLFKALQTIPAADAATEQARALALRLVKAGVNIPSRLEFDDLIALDAVQKLANTDPEAFALLEVFIGGDLEDYEEFNDEHDGWVDDNGIDHPIAFRKIRLLTLASLASQAPNRELPYNIIARRLHIPSEEVELWVIDVIRAGLVEGKLSQLNQTFLIHRSTYRSFGKHEWEEVAGRLDIWRQSLRGILETVRGAREAVVEQHGKEQQASANAVERAGRSLEIEA
ncbi:uncharacterized protein LAJ45_07365 [Morchella importuna]|uniref:Eukaryotic translation initiation factor 3 subunit M n=1 Tax=Morchella conica CCBAS932 TaxID=1392247 RepID=A0A3N4LAD8_9PEZI|nr:uncharacterized protein LAJ45_07365 [Morchella importuna]KAH8148654.1 hypothetical protein LAJ45_07365 [Morchella importuna]RPB14975.1 PCI-domain-containing protein [Morchella conica CCBAS932]